MNIIKKFIISIVIIMIILATVLPSSSHADLTPEQQSQLRGFAISICSNYGHDTGKSRYDSGLLRMEIRDFFYGHKNVIPFHADCSSFTAFIYYQLTNGKVDMGFSNLAWSTGSYPLNAQAYFYKKGRIPESQMQPGDISWYRNEAKGEGHVQVYIGNGEWINEGGGGENYNYQKGIEITGLDSRYMTIYRLKDGIYEGDFNTVIDGTTFFDPSSPGSLSGSSSGEVEYSEEDYDEELFYKPEDFNYYGLPLAKQLKTNLITEILPFRFTDIIDYIVGVLFLAIKIPVIGYTEIIEMLMSTGLEAAMGMDVTENNVSFLDEKIVTSIANSFIFLFNSSRNVSIENIVYNRIPILNINIFDVDGIRARYESYRGTGELTGQVSSGVGEQAQSILEIISENIAVWYYVFRNFVIIGMLLVLIYVGIRMALSTIAEGRAKYKRMLVAWLVSFIIVMGIHYYMILIIQLNENFVNLIIPKAQVSTQSQNQGNNGQGEGTRYEITLYETVRSRAYELKASRAIVGTMLYVLLVWYTIKFLWIYAKRFLAIMVLILMAPFTAASFAITKVKSGKTPIFDNWMKEFTFNVLIQSVHAFLYSTFVILALKMEGDSVAGIVLAFILLKIMSESDKLVRRIFKIRGGSKNSILDNNLSVDEEIQSAIQNPLGILAGGAVGKAYMKKWVKPVVSKGFGVAKNVVGIPAGMVGAAIITGARNNLTKNPNPPQSNPNPPSGKFAGFIDNLKFNNANANYALMNALASMAMTHEKMPLLDKNGKEILGDDGKPIFIKKANWKSQGMFVFGRDGILRYVYIKKNTERDGYSDLRLYVPQQRKLMNYKTKQQLKKYLIAGGNAIKGAALIYFSLPLLMDMPAFGFGMFLEGMHNMNPVMRNRRADKIKGFKKPIRKEPIKYKFKRYGKDALNLVSSVALAGVNLYVRPIQNAQFEMEEFGRGQEKNAKILENLYEEREQEADLVENVQEVAKTLLEQALNASGQTYTAGKVATPDIQSQLDTLESILKTYAKKGLTSKDLYKSVTKECKEMSKDVRIKISIHEFLKQNKRRQTSEEIIQNISVPLESDVKNILGIGVNTSFVIEQTKINKLKEKLRETYGDALGVSFESKIDTYVIDKLEKQEDVIKTNDLTNYLQNILINEKIMQDAVFSSDDISGIRGQLETYMQDQGVTFDAQMEQHIKDKINSSSNTLTNNKGEKVITGKDLKEMLYREVKERNNVNEDEILSKEEVASVVEMMRQQHKADDKPETYSSDFIKNIEKQMQEKIIENAIDDYIKDNSKSKKLNDKALKQLEENINQHLRDNGYSETMQEVLANRRVDSKLDESLERSFENHLSDSELKKDVYQTKIGKLASMLENAAKEEKSLEYDLKLEENGIDNEQVRTIVDNLETLRAMNRRGERLGVKRKDRNGHKLPKDGPILDLNEIVESMMKDLREKSTYNIEIDDNGHVVNMYE